MVNGRNLLSAKPVHIPYPGTLDRRTLTIMLLLRLCGLPILGSSFPSHSLYYVSASHPITRSFTSSFLTKIVLMWGSRAAY